ncbi:MAG: radical SAM protein [Elusimicrobia bacterium]|nr:radical SAM protein [Elusimicrobiota bacterium]
MKTMIKRIDLKIGFDCNNLCDFCAQGDKRSANKMRSLDEIKKILVNAKKQKILGVVFTGGEPTLHPDILDAVKFARGAGFNTIQVQTNGRKFAYYEFCAELKKAGATEMGPSIHGSRARIHDSLTHSKGSFRQVVQGIINSKKLGLFVLTNTVITSRNYQDLPELARLLVYLGVDQFQLAFIHMVGTAWKNRKWLVPEKSVVIDYVHKALDIGRTARVRCYTEAIPFCFMRGYEDCVAERIIPEGPVADAGFYLDSYGDYRRREGKIKHEKCRKCLYFKICEGPWKEYPEIYGWSEFKAVIKSQVSSLRSQGAGHN